MTQAASCRQRQEAPSDACGVPSVAMTEQPQPSPRAGRTPMVAALVAVSLVVILLGAALVWRSAPPPAGPGLVLEKTPSVVVALRELQRLESYEIAVEKIVDLKHEQSRAFDLIRATDALLLVAVGQVTLGVDLAALDEADVETSWAERRAHIRLPAVTVLSSRLDNEKTYVHSRTTGLLARRDEQLESEARRIAARAAAAAADSPDARRRAAASAARTVESLVRALGFRDVVVEVRPPS